MAGFLIGVVAFVLPLTFGVTGLGRTRIVLTVGAVLAIGWVISLAQHRATNTDGNPFVPLWFLGGLVALLFAIWCGGLWLGVRVRRMRRTSPG